MKRLRIIILAVILCSCAAVERANPTDNGAVQTAFAIITSTLPREVLSVTSTPEVLLSPSETPFWLSYEGGTPVPIATGYPQSSRADYLEMDVNVGVGAYIWLPPFKESFEAALVNNQDWIKYPERVALRITGHPNPDYLFPDEVLLFYTTQDTVIVIMSDWKLMDDSVSAVQYQIEMSRSGDHWQVDWLGRKWRCQRKRGHEDWGIELCH